MKKITLIIAVICTHFAAIAQQHHHAPGLDKFVGIWTYNKDGKEVEIELKIVTQSISLQTTMDVLEGFHVYKKNGKKIDSSKERNKISFHGVAEDRDTPNLIKLLFFDDPKQKNGEGTLTFIPGNPDQIKLTIMNTKGLKIRRNGEKEEDPTFSIPESITLQRK